MILHELAILNHVFHLQLVQCKLHPRVHTVNLVNSIPKRVLSDSLGLLCCVPALGFGLIPFYLGRGNLGFELLSLGLKRGIGSLKFLGRPPLLRSRRRTWPESESSKLLEPCLWRQ